MPLLAVPFLAWLLPAAPEATPVVFSPEKINLALRRTADGLLRQSGDSTSRIPAIEQSGAGVWRVKLEQPFVYEQLPNLLQASLDQYGITMPYEVAVRRCFDSTIDLGYHQLDYLENKAVPCGGREMPEGCHYIEISFLNNDKNDALWANKAVILVMFLGGLAGIWFYRWQKSMPLAPLTTATSALTQSLPSQAFTSVGGPGTDWLEFGKSRLDVSSQVLFCNEIRQTLTFRETKLLRLFVTHPDRLLERDLILREVWADEGVLVGRSVDVFVSRLRKKLSDDPTVGIVAVHGVGYRLETGKEV